MYRTHPVLDTAIKEVKELKESYIINDSISYFSISGLLSHLCFMFWFEEDSHNYLELKHMLWLVTPTLLLNINIHTTLPVSFTHSSYLWVYALLRNF